MPIWHLFLFFLNNHFLGVSYYFRFCRVHLVTMYVDIVSFIKMINTFKHVVKHDCIFVLFMVPSYITLFYIHVFNSFPQKFVWRIQIMFIHRRDTLQILLVLYFLLSYDGVQGEIKLSKLEELALDKQLKLLNKPAIKTFKVYI